MSTGKRLLTSVIAFAAVAAHADVTVTTLTSGKAAFIDLGGEGVSQFKGTRQRTDQMINGKMQSLIIDIDGRRFVSLDAKKKSAVVTPLDIDRGRAAEGRHRHDRRHAQEDAEDQADRRLPLHCSRHQRVAAVQPHRAIRPGHGSHHGDRGHRLPEHRGARTRGLPGFL